MNQIKGYEGRYFVTVDGDVWPNLSSKWLKKHLSIHGYQTVYLWLNGRGKHKKIHRIVAETFIPNFGGKPEVNHKDGNKLNNRVDNLEWCTSQENSEHFFRKEYSVISPQGEVFTFINQNRFCRENNLHQGNFNMMLNGKFKQSKGWKLA